MSFKFDEKKIKKFITMSPESEDLAALEEEYTKGYDWEEPLWAHKLELEELEDLLSAIKTIKMEFDPAVHAREAAENAYSVTIYLMYHLARRFHPLSEYGKDFMLRAYKLRQEYEKEFKAPMVTGINADNCESFKGIISEDVLEAISNGTYNGLGMFRTDVDRLVPVGAAAYTWTEYPEDFDEAPVIDVKWLYIDEDYRGNSYSDFLIGELVTLMIRKNASGMTLSVPVDEYYETWLQLFAEWKFDVSTGLNPEFRISINDVPEKSKVYVFNANATSFNDITPAKEDLVIQSFLKASDEKELYGRLTGRGRYYDRDLSCFTGTETKPTGLLLAHKKPSGEIEIEYIGYTAEVGEDVMALVGSCISAAKSKFGAATDIILYPDSEEFESFLDKFLPSPKVVPMIIGFLSDPEEIQASADVITEVLDSLKLEEEASEE